MRHFRGFVDNLQTKKESTREKMKKLYNRINIPSKVNIKIRRFEKHECMYIFKRMKQDIFNSFLCISKKSCLLFGLNVLSACCKQRKP